jgi:PTS system cellobiose-specific IIC component
MAMSDTVEKKIIPIANKFARQRHMVAIRDAFMSILPLNLAGGLCAIIKSPPITNNTTNGFLLAWKAFAESNSLLLNWLYAFTLGGMSLYICLGITYFLCQHYKLKPMIPMLLSLAGFMMLVTQPIEISFEASKLSFTYLDGKGLIPAIIISIGTTELYRIMKEKNIGNISMPESVPASLSDAFAVLISGILILLVHTLVFQVFHAMETSFPQFMYKLLTPAFKAADSLPSVIIISLLTHLFWFFGIHDAALSGVVGPIRDGNLSMNASAAIAGEALPHIFTTPFWVYFTAIGGCGATLGLCIVLLTCCKSKQLKTVAKVGVVPAFFNISEPIIFGLPLMLNPIFFVPFLLTSTVNAIITYLAMQFNIIARSFVLVSWQMPSVFGAFFATMDWKAPILIILLIIIDALMYLPFVKIYDKALYKQEKETTTADN